MKSSPASLLQNIPESIPVELCQTLYEKPNIRIERILSYGHQSPEDYWYDQEQDEWVLLLQGQAKLAFADNSTLELQAGSYVLIPAHCKHRVEWTPPNITTIWLAIHVFEETG